MIFTEFRFFVFAAIVLAIYWAIPTDKYRKGWLLLVSYFFYGMWDWRFLSLIFLSTGVDYAVGLAMEAQSDEKKKRWLLILSLAVNLGVLGYFKYWNFFVDSFADAAGSMGLTVDPILLDIILPVGISFYTFQTLSYTLDIYRGSLRATRSLLDFSLFVAFFPQLVAGPIVRARDFLHQLDRKRAWAEVDLRWALTLFLLGFFKKACVADNLAPYVDGFFENPALYGTIDSWLATLMYSAQIYCDFSGYSDMAIAMAGLMGYRLTENFNAPYFASDIADFWRRWHISLSSWLRDYLYISLGGNRGGQLRTYRNLILTMLLGGLWHGASWNFVLWGAIHGVSLALDGITVRHRAPWPV